MTRQSALPPFVAAPAMRQFTGWHMLVILLAFFGVVIAVNLVMARLALSTFSGEVVANSYVASQHFNGWLDKAKAESALGWKAPMALADDRLTVAMIDNRGNPLAGAQLSGEATHPLGATTDLRLRFVENRPGVYSARLPAGRWQIRMMARADGHEWHHLAEVTSGAAQ